MLRPGARILKTRWKSPPRVRSERYGQLHGSTRFKDVFDQKFLDGLERRKELLESRLGKASVLNLPIFALLAFSLLQLDIKLSIAGFSIESARGLREILLFFLALKATYALPNNLLLSDTTEVLRAAIDKISGGQNDIRHFLKVRYGLLGTEPATEFDGSLFAGRGYRFAFHALGVLVSVMSATTRIIGFGVIMAVIVLTMREIWLHPNFSPAVSIVVIVYSVSTAIVSELIIWYWVGPQPFQTWETIEDMASQHWRRGFLSRLLFWRPLRSAK
jgi:hypothetical protein